MAAAAGLPLLSKEERNPLHTTTYGVGELIRDAIRKGCRHFIVGIGGSATNDGGVGMLSALGFEFLDKSGQPVRNGAAGLADLAEIRSGHVLPVLKECTFRVAVTWKIPSAESLAAAAYSDRKRVLMKRASGRWINGSFPMHS